MFNSEIALKVTMAVWTRDKMYYYRQREGSTFGGGKSNNIRSFMYAQKYVHQMFLNQSADFVKRYTAYTLNRMADAWSKSWINHFSDEKEVRATFTDYYDRYHSLIRGTREEKKLFLQDMQKIFIFCIRK